jgi:exodeoxyribonuclease V
MSWSPQQDQAIKAVKQWLADKRGPQIFRLFGYAGSGKTTLAKHMAEDVGGEVLYMAFTGKAALVLRKKGCVGASTIHSAIYKPQEDPVTGHMEFKLNPDSPVATAGLVVVDEVSMVGEDLARDLLSFGSKVLVLGDPAQLPPVKGEGFFINAQPDVMLTEVHRQAAENPIIRMSMDVREGRGLAPGAYGTSQVIRRADIDRDQLRGMVMAADQLLCGMNKTRQMFNNRIREIRELGGRIGSPTLQTPVVGDRLVCLKNNRMKGLFNGGLWDVDKVVRRPGRTDMLVSSVDEPGTIPVDIQVPDQFFLGTEKDMDWRERKRADEFTYGYALTVHKSQGSAWDDVLVFDESSVFREDAAKHLYTAVTRAAERVTVVV